MSALFSSVGGSIPGMASSSSSGPARSSNSIFVGASGGSTSDLARIINITSGAEQNGGFTGRIFPQEDTSFTSGVVRTNPNTQNSGVNTGLILGIVALVVLAVIMLKG